MEQIIARSQHSARSGNKKPAELTYFPTSTFIKNLVKCIAIRYTMSVMKKAMSFRLTEEASRLLKSLAESIGVSQTAIIEIAIREAAKQTAISEESKRLREALKTIGTECENYTAPHSCWTAGRIQNAEFGADSVCPHCIAARALAPKRSEK